MKLIINADDFGYSKSVNTAVISLMEAGIVTSATLMAGADFLTEAVQRAGDFKHCSFGVHLSLTELKSLTSPEIFSEQGLIGEDGCFTGEIRQAMPSRQLKEAIYNEWSAQVERILDCGVKPSHFDSHHHIHTVPWLFGTLKRLQERFGVWKVRASLNWYTHDKKPSSPKLFQKGLWNFALRYWHRTKVTDYFTRFEWFVHEMTEGEAACKLGLTELMTHPGQPFAIEETKLLLSDWRLRIKEPLELISYNDL